MNSWGMTLLLSGLAGAATLGPLMLFSRRYRSRSMAAVTRLARWVGLPLLGAEVMVSLLALYPIGGYLTFLIVLLGMAAVTIAWHHPRTWHCWLAPMVAVVFIGSEGVLASGAAGGFWSFHPHVCAGVGGARSVPTLLSILRTHRDNPSVVEDAVSQLLEVGDTRDSALLVSSLAVGRGPNYDFAVRSLRGRGASAVPVLLAALKDPDAPGYAAAAVLAFMDEPAVSGLLQVAEDPRLSPASRVAAIDALSRSRETRAVPSLLAILNSGDDRTALPVAAAQALGDIGDRRATLPLLACLQDRSRPDRVRVTAAWAAGALRDPRALPVLMAVLVEREPTTVRNGVAMGLAEMRGIAAPALIAGIEERLRRDTSGGLEDGDWMAWALGEMKEPSARPVLLAADRRAHYRDQPCVFCRAIKSAGGRNAPLRQ